MSNPSPRALLLTASKLPKKRNVLDAGCPGEERAQNLCSNEANDRSADFQKSYRRGKKN